MNDTTSEALKQLAVQLESLVQVMFACDRTPNRYARRCEEIGKEIAALAAVNAAEAKPATEGLYFCGGEPLIEYVPPKMEHDFDAALPDPVPMDAQPLTNEDIAKQLWSKIADGANDWTTLGADEIANLVAAVADVRGQLCRMNAQPETKKEWNPYDAVEKDQPRQAESVLKSAAQPVSGALDEREALLRKIEAGLRADAEREYHDIANAGTYLKKQCTVWADRLAARPTNQVNAAQPEKDAELSLGTLKFGKLEVHNPDLYEVPNGYLAVKVEALELIYEAMNYMGDVLNNMDAVEDEDIEKTSPAFDAIRELLAAQPTKQSN